VRLGRREIRILIDEHDLRTDTTHHHGISGGGARLPDTNDPDLQAIPPLVWLPFAGSKSVSTQSIAGYFDSRFTQAKR
jgi:hypothetical protein